MKRYLAAAMRSCLAVVTVLTLALAAGGCGDDDGGGQTTTASFSGKPLTVYYMAPIKTPLADYSDAAAAVRAAARAINADGGLDGHELKVEVCSDSDANAEVECTRRAAREGALAFIGSSFIYNPVAGEEILRRQRIASIASQVSSQAELANPINFPLYVPPLGLLACPQQLLDGTDASSVASIAQDLPIQKELLRIIGGVAAATRLPYAGDVSVPTSQTDFAAAARSLADTGADGVVNVLAPTAQVPFFSAVRSIGASFEAFCSGPSLYTNATLKQLGEQADAIYVSTGLPPTSSEAAARSPTIRRFRDEMEAAAAAGDDDAALDKLILPSNALNGWLGVQVLKQVAAQVPGQLTSAALLAALDRAQVDLGGVVPPLDFSRPVPARGFERVFNPLMRLYRWDSQSGDYVETDAEPVNVLEVLAALARGGA